MSVTTRQWAVALRESERKWKRWLAGKPTGACALCDLAQESCLECPLGVDQGGSCTDHAIDPVPRFEAWFRAESDSTEERTAARQLAEQLGRLAAEYERRADEEEA